MHKNILDCFDSYYFIGIGGVSMSALAKYLLDCGKFVAGSDICGGDTVDELRGEGISVCTGSGRESIADFDAVIYSDAIPENDIQLGEARSLGKFILSRGQLLSEISKSFGRVIAVSGCHGKTTCTAMLAHIFSAAGKGFCAHIGGKDLKFGNYYRCGSDYFITEACEYKKNFLLLKPDTAVVLNTRPDHLECYGSEENLKLCYSRFLCGAEGKISLYKDIATDGLTFGFDKNADYYAGNITETDGFYSFKVFEKGCELGNVCLKVYGKHNILNALAAIAAARSEKISFTDIQAGLSSFEGVERRFETLGESGGVRYIADYAHHPDEIRASVRTVQRLAKGRLFVVFQPHTYSRTKNLMKQFIKVLSNLNNLLIYRTYAAREYYDDAGSALTLSQKIKKSRYGDDAKDIAEFISRASAGDAVLFLGAGDIYDIAKKVVGGMSD